MFIQVKETVNQNKQYIECTTIPTRDIKIIIIIIYGHALVQLVEALRYQSAGHGFDSRWYHWNFSLTQFFRPLYGPGVDSASNRNQYQEYFLEGTGGWCLGLTTLPPSCAASLEIWEPHLLGKRMACPGLYLDCFIFTINNNNNNITVINKSNNTFSS